MIARAGLALALGIMLGAAGCSSPSAADSGGAAVAVGKIETLTAADLATRLGQGKVQLIDVRTAEEFAQGHIAGAINLPLDSFDPKALPAAQSGQQIVLYCRSGRRSGIATERMIAAGAAQARHLEGGILAWQAAGLPLAQ